MINTYKFTLCTYVFSRPGSFVAKVTIGENKQFADNRLTVKSNIQNFKADYKVNVKANYVGRGEDVFEMKVTELNSDVTYAKIKGRFPNKV